MKNKASMLKKALSVSETVVPKDYPENPSYQDYCKWYSSMFRNNSPAPQTVWKLTDRLMRLKERGLKKRIRLPLRSLQQNNSKFHSSKNHDIDSD